ncbi:MAG TPA: hypothetical protein VGB18_03695 [Candidatus Thermoplasmatota archaeon]
MRASPTLAFAIPILFFAGCLDEAPPAAELLPHGHDGDMAHADFSFEATDCEEGGFVATYSGETTYPGGWKSADVYEEVGKPVHDGLALPVVPGTPLNGNWHMGYRCASVTHDGEIVKDFVFGRVGQMIQAPAFDPGGADQHFISTGFALGNGTIGDALREATPADISHAYNTYVQWVGDKDLPRSYAYAIFSDYEKGVYETYGDISPYRDFPARTIRMWWTVPADGSESSIAHDHGTGTGGGGVPPSATEVTAWNPVYWDITTTGGQQYTTPPVGAEIGFHNKGSMEHGVPTQPMLTNIYQHESLTFTYGGVLRDVVIDELWVH